jgi:hypothetical protein
MVLIITIIIEIQEMAQESRFIAPSTILPGPCLVYWLIVFYKIR